MTEDMTRDELAPIDRHVAKDVFVEHCLHHLRRMDTRIPYKVAHPDDKSFFDVDRPDGKIGFFGAVILMMCKDLPQQENMVVSVGEIEKDSRFVDIEKDCRALAESHWKGEAGNGKAYQHQKMALIEDLQKVGFGPAVAHETVRDISNLFAGRTKAKASPGDESTHAGAEEDRQNLRRDGRVR